MSDRSQDRIDYDDRGDLDDIVVSDVEMFRMERMDAGQFWIRLYRADGDDHVFWLSSARKIKGTHHHDPRTATAETEGRGK